MAQNLEKVGPRRVPSSRHKFLSFFLSLGVFSWNFGGLKRRDPETCTFGVLGLSCELRRPGLGSHTAAENSKRAHASKNTTKIPREDTQREKKNEKGAAEGTKRVKIWRSGGGGSGSGGSGWGSNPEKVRARSACHASQRMVFPRDSRRMVPSDLRATSQGSARAVAVVFFLVALGLWLVAKSEKPQVQRRWQQGQGPRGTHQGMNPDMLDRNKAGFHVAAAGAAREELMRLGFEAPSWESVTAGRRPAVLDVEDRQIGMPLGWQQAATDAVHTHVVETSQGGPLSGVPFQCFLSNVVSLFDSSRFRMLLLRRLWLPLPPSSRSCRCGRPLDVLGHHRAACAEVGVLGRRGYALESAAARICREAGARVGTNIMVRDMDLLPQDRQEDDEHMIRPIDGRHVVPRLESVDGSALLPEFWVQALREDVDVPCMDEPHSAATWFDTSTDSDQDVECSTGEPRSVVLGHCEAAPASSNAVFRGRVAEVCGDRARLATHS